MKATQKTKKALTVVAALLLCVASLSAGGSKENAQAFDTAKAITVVSREDGSGTRGAFIELTGIEKKDANGKKMDYTTTEALITNSTSVMMTTTARDTYAIGYISLGFINDSVKALNIDGAEPTVAAIQEGRYKVVRPFNIVTGENCGNAPSENAKDFIRFILSTDGQKIVADNGFIALDNTKSYTPSALNSQKVVVAGSSSVTPVMEKLKEAYQIVQPTAVIEIQQSDSTTGVTSVQNGICSIGMASRALKTAESASGLTATVIAKDGIAVIVNNKNPLDGLTKEQVQKIFTGKITTWKEVNE